MRKLIINNELNDDWIRSNNPKQVDEISILKLMIAECLTVNHSKSNMKHPGHSPQSVHGNRGSIVGGGISQESIQKVIDKPKSDYVDHMKDYIKDPDLLTKTINQEYDTWRNSLSENEIESINYYTRKGYGVINQSLRENLYMDDTLKKQIASLDNAIDSCVVHEDCIVRRGITATNTSETYNAMSQLKTGDIISDKAYMSTSIGASSGGIIQLEIRVPKGTPAIFVGDNSLTKYTDENEFIFPRNTLLYINSVRIVNENVWGEVRNSIYIDATVLPQIDIPVNIEKSYNLKHPGHEPQSVHNPHKGFSAKTQTIINKPDSDFKNLNNKLDAMGIYHYMNDKSSVKTQASLLTSNERSAIGKYCANMYSVINTSLRYNDNNTYSEEINNLDSAIRKGTIDEDIMVERGLVTSKNGGVSSSIYKQFKNMSVGDVWVDPAYISTSVSEGFDGFIQMKIRIPKGTNGIFVGTSNLSSNPLENEYILPRGSKFYINNISIGENRKLSVTATVLPQED